MSPQAGFVDHKVPVAKVKPAEFKVVAKRACKLNVEKAKATYPRVQDDNLPYLCMDLVYQFTLLVDGFGALKLMMLLFNVVSLPAILLTFLL